jgi:hypothetical protein
MIRAELLKFLPKTLEEYIAKYGQSKGLKPTPFLINGKVKEL